MSILMEGDSTKITRGVLTAAQIAIYNFRSRTVTGEHRHIYTTPLVWYISFLLHNKYRYKELMNDLNKLGLCRAYTLMLEFSSSLGKAEITRYNEQNLVCPTKLKVGLVTTLAVDNIDQSTSSMTATSSLHGTAISITQHPSGFSDGIEQPKVTVTKCSNNKLLALPNNYTSVPGVIMKDRINITLDNMMSNEHFELLQVSVDLDEQIKKEKEWMDNVRRIQILAEAEQIAEQSHWAAYHAVCQQPSPTTKVVSAVPPIFHESAATRSMMKHSLDISLSTTNFLNEAK